MDTQFKFVPPKYAITKAISRQVFEPDDIEMVETLGDMLIVFVASAAALTLSMSCFTGIGLKPIIDSLKTLQIIVHYMLIVTFSVAQCEIFFSKLLLISNMQVFDPSSIFIEYLPVVKN